ncbi:3-oxoadipate enol-lactonase [Sphingobium sp.]|uniref:3-oxoadipate enol-lactonase n=1 Tax=Sphingobium sp. TaxID=1912891 RepID=UPI00261C4D2C|nr:3-oxoadipate enol-lactonase [Sphingobium sp.]
MPFVQSSGAAIYWKLEGAEGALALVLLNSIGTDMDLWDAALPALRARFRLLRIDTRGHGASAAPDGDYSLPMLAGDVFAVMDAAGVAQAAVAGVSLGGMIAMQMTLDAPDRVSALVPVCTSATMDSAAWDARIAKVRGEGMASIADLAMGRFLSPEYMDAQPAMATTVRRALIGMAAAGYAGCGAAIRDMAIAARLGEIRVPTLVVIGTRDTSTPYEGHGEHLIGGIAGAQHVALEAAHLVPIEAPELLASAIANFLHG